MSLAGNYRIFSGNYISWDADRLLLIGGGLSFYGSIPVRAILSRVFCSIEGNHMIVLAKSLFSFLRYFNSRSYQNSAGNVESEVQKKSSFLCSVGMIGIEYSHRSGYPARHSIRSGSKMYPKSQKKSTRRPIMHTKNRWHSSSSWTRDTLKNSSAQLIWTCANVGARAKAINANNKSVKESALR